MPDRPLTPEEQRAERRRGILDATAALLAGTPVAKLSLGDIGRAVGLATSNVLRYFESREAILLDLLDEQQSGWAAALGTRIAPSDAPLPERATAAARMLAASLEERPVLCELLAARSTVLERDVSVHVLLRHRYAAADVEESLVPVVRRLLPELVPHRAHRLVATALMVVPAVWSQAHPSRSLLAALEADPHLAREQHGFADAHARLIEDVTLGLLSRG
jgi:AcrR family transcriptional regulator